MSSQCTAINLHDKLRCEEAVGSLNGLFCSFHSKQCQGLYRGYKLRNARLDSLAESPPEYLANSAVSLANQTFADVKSEATLHELHAYLSLKHALLDRVIRARKIHHTRFYSVTLDYGHQHYLDSLSSQKSIVLHALQQLERQTIEVSYQRRNWFKWVRQRQDEEEKHRDSEKKRIKQESALFERHSNQHQLRLKEQRLRENFNRQEEFLEEAYRERMRLEEDDAKWDPIDDVVEDERDHLVDMINLFLMLKEEAQKDSGKTLDETPASRNGSNKSKKKSNRKESALEPREKTGLETKSQMRKRLKEGVPYSNGGGLLLEGTVENPIEVANRTAPLADHEVDQLLEEITEIKHLLFCRLLLSHASLLAIAIRAKSVEELLKHPEVNVADLRDLCIKMENPGLPEVRDACADLVRGDDEDVDFEEKAIVEVPDNKESKGRFDIPKWRRSRAMPQVWISKRDQQLQVRRRRQQKIMDQGTGGSEGTFFDFGTIDDDTEQRGKRMRIKVCGKSIWNYPSEKAMNRGGWLHFSVIAKDSSLFDAVKLCRHWDELFELNTLAAYQFFLAANWMEWVGDCLKQQHLQLGFIMYQDFRDADKVTHSYQSGSRGQVRRSHAALEARNFIAANVKRNDQASRRLIRYLSMQTNRVLLLVRDAKTGRILISPPEDELWLIRQKSGFGRAVKHEWNVVKAVGSAFFEELESTRRWTFGFKDYYDIIVWDLDPGERFSNVYQTVTEMLFKAHRFHDMRDTYSIAAPILKTVTKDPNSHRVREIRPGEEVESLYDRIHHPGTQFAIFDDKKNPVEKIPRNLFYSDADALEDQVLFPEETQGPGDDNSVGAALNSLVVLEEQGPDMKRFLYDLDTDEDVPVSKPGSTDGKSTSDDDSDLDFEDDEDDDHDDLEDYIDLELDLNEPVPSQTPADNERKTFVSYLTRHVKPSLESNQTMMEQYQRFMKRESSKVFKESWHRADFEPGAGQKHIESADLVKKMEICLGSHPSIVGPLTFLDLNPFEHRRVLPDMRHAYAMMALFFTPASQVSEAMLEMNIHEHLILNQSERVKTLPDRRTYHSNNTMPKEFWKEWDVLAKTGRLDDCFPVEWDMKIRPMIAHLYKEGILRSSYVPGVAGQAFAHKEPGRDLDLFVDFRLIIDDIALNPGLEEPPPTDHILSLARKFSAANETARFAMLRVWSAPHFYPLLIGLQKHQRVAFFDSQGRAWEWKFIPKDMPYSEWSMHQQARLRIKPFKRVFGDRVLVKRDLFLVMGTDEKDLLKLATAATYAIQTDPWRLEVDLWKSFVNVDMDFLETLRDVWMD